MCYEYDWMQEPQADEQSRKAQQQRAELIGPPPEAPPPKPPEPARVVEPATA